MCKIIGLPEGVMLPFDKFKNACNNNPHGFGLILKDTKNSKIEVIRRCPEGGNDPQEIYDLLEDNKDMERYLHLRFRTDGPINLDNTHPFTAFHSDARQVYLMHNGILNHFKPKAGITRFENGVKFEEPGEDMSDSKKFNDTWLHPLLSRLHGKEGPGDITDEFFQDLLDKVWTSTSKGILIANDLPTVLINSSAWKKMDMGMGDFWASNDSYFNHLLRGPVFEKEQEEKRKKEAEAATKRSRFQGGNGRNSQDNIAITELKDITFKAASFPSEALADIMEDYDIWSSQGMASLDQMTPAEFDGLIAKAPEEARNLFIYLTSYHAELVKKYDSVLEYLKKQNTEEARKLIGKENSNDATAH